MCCRASNFVLPCVAWRYFTLLWCVLRCIDCITLLQCVASCWILWRRIVLDDVALRCAYLCCIALPFIAMFCCALLRIAVCCFASCCFALLCIALLCSLLFALRYVACLTPGTFYMWHILLCLSKNTQCNATPSRTKNSRSMQCNAMQYDVKQCKMTQINAKQCKTLESTRTNCCGCPSPPQAIREGGSSQSQHFRPQVIIIAEYPLTGL